MYINVFVLLFKSITQERAIVDSTIRCHYRRVTRMKMRSAAIKEYLRAATRIANEMKKSCDKTWRLAHVSTPANPTAAKLSWSGFNRSPNRKLNPGNPSFLGSSSLLTGLFPPSEDSFAGSLPPPFCAYVLSLNEDLQKRTWWWWWGMLLYEKGGFSVIGRKGFSVNSIVVCGVQIKWSLLELLSLICNREEEKRGQTESKFSRRWIYQKMKDYQNDYYNLKSKRIPNSRHEFY